MAKSGRTPAPRNCRHGHSRAPLSAARRTFASSGQAWLANLFGPAAPASPRAAIHLAHSSKRSRSDPDHAAARHAGRSQGFCAASRRLDRRASRPVAEGRAFQPGTVVPLRGVPHRIVHRAGERGTVWTETRDSGEQILCVAGGVEHIERRVHDYLKREARKDLQKASQAYAEELGVRVKRVSIRDQSSRWGSCTSAGSLSFSWRLILAPPYVLDYLAAHEVAHLVEMNHSARFWRVVAQGLRPCRARQDLARHPRQRPASLRDPGLRLRSTLRQAVIARARGRSGIPERSRLRSRGYGVWIYCVSASRRLKTACTRTAQATHLPSEQPIHQPAIQSCGRFRARRWIGGRRGRSCRRRPISAAAMRDRRRRAAARRWPATRSGTGST